MLGISLRIQRPVPRGNKPIKKEQEMARRTLVLDQPVETVETTKKKSRKGIFIGIAMIALVPVIGSTYAASITVNSGGIEFGQGTSAVTACDSTINTALASTWNNTDSKFYVSSVTLSDVNTSTKSSGVGCNGETLTVKLLNSSGTVLDTIVLTITNTSGSMKPSGVTSGGATTDTIAISTSAIATDLAASGGDPLAATVDASQVARVTVESS